MDRTQATPVEIDTRINQLDYAYGSLLNQQRVAELTKNGVAKARVQGEIHANRDERWELEAEYESRGTWTRAYVVPAGHVHASYWCHTLFVRTQRYLAAPVSGFDEAQVVEAAGERACTVCYPSAPVDVLKRKTRLFTPDEEQAERERAERAAVKAEKDALKAARAISNPDGTPLKIDGWVLESERTAQTRYVDLASYVQACDRGYAYRGSYKESKEGAETILTALAHKRDTTVDEQRAALAAKVAKKAKGYLPS